ncbi:MAG: DegT/DnrJ/EryC1/StrS family aminotransferase [Bacteroidales bacterium]
MSLNKRIFLCPPHMGGTEQQHVNQAFETNWIAPLGPNVDGFETDLCGFTGAKHAAALSAGTAALHLALILSDVKPDDFVICQSFTFSASANPITYQGAMPVFVDSEEETWNMCPIQLERAIEACLSGEIEIEGKGKMGAKKPKAIIPVHLYGMPAKMDEILAIAQKYDIPIIEDAAESLGSTYKDKQTGTFGRFSILSFNGNKIITTSGGGALLTNDETLIQKARYLSTQARDPAPHYQHSHIGYNYRMSNVLAGIGRGQMEVLHSRVKRHREIFDWYLNLLNSINKRGYKVVAQPELEASNSNRWLTAILIDPRTNKGITSEKLRLAFEEFNIESRPLWKPMHLQPVFNYAPFFGDGTSEKLFEQGLCLPSGSNMSEEDFHRIKRVFDNIFV